MFKTTLQLNEIDTLRELAELQARAERKIKLADTLAIEATHYLNKKFTDQWLREAIDNYNKA